MRKRLDSREAAGGTTSGCSLPSLHPYFCIVNDRSRSTDGEMEDSLQGLLGCLVVFSSTEGRSTARLMFCERGSIVCGIYCLDTAQRMWDTIKLCSGRLRLFLTTTLKHTTSPPSPSRPVPKAVRSGPWHSLLEYKTFSSHAISTAFPFFVRRRDKNIVSQSCLDI